MKTIKDVLATRLSEADLSRLQELTGNWRVNPFEFCTDCEVFQTSDEWEYEHMDLSDDDLDLLFRACEILNEFRGEVLAPVRKENVLESMALDFTFFEGHEKDDLTVGEKFVDLLRQSPAYRVNSEEFPGGMRVQVIFNYRGELEYARQRDDILLLLDSARNIRHHRKFKGHRL